MGRSHIKREGTEGTLRPANAMALMRKSQQMRRWHLNNPWCRPILTMNYSALIIQRSVRRHATPQSKEVKIEKCVGSIGGSRDGRQLNKYLARLDYYKVMKKSRPLWIDDGYSSWCAVQIQSYWRMRLWSQRYLRSRMMIYQIAALTVQSAWRMFLLKRRLFLELSRKSGHEAALIIQACWRSYSCRRIFKYFRDLVCITLKGAPSDLLRSIIPNESSFLDPASGTHVRFRLGGHRFPPEVYFKIFTHRPLCDVNSFAPRDYNSERKSEITAGVGINRISTAGKQEDLGLGLKVGARYFGTSVVTYTAVDKWYKRDEGNSWRPIAASKMNDFKVPPWLQGSVDHSSIKRFSKFHFSKLRRDVDIERQRKQRRRLWMMKAYRIATASWGTVCTELAGTVDIREDYHDSRIIGNAMPFEGMSSGSVKNRSDAHKVRMCNNWCPNGSNDDRDDGESKGLPEHFLSSHGSVFDTKYSSERVSLPSVPVSEESARSVATKYTRSDCEDDSEMLKWSLALDFNEYNAAWQSMGNSRSQAR